MRRDPLRLAGLVAAGLLAACATGPETPADGAAPAPATTEEPAGPADDAGAAGQAGTDPAATDPSAAPSADPGDTGADRAATAAVPHIYLALQPGGTGHPVSAVFAIDSNRDGNPSDDPAIRLTPDAGRCNPQEMRRFDFPPEAATPVVSEAELARGLTAEELPRFLAAAVTGRLIDAGLAGEPEDTRPLNVCTRKLWERLVVARNSDRLADRQ